MKNKKPGIWKSLFRKANRHSEERSDEESLAKNTRTGAPRGYPPTTPASTTHPPSPIPHPPSKNHAFDQPILEWESHERPLHERGQTWHLASATFVIGMVVYAILTNSATMAIAFLLMAGVYKLVNSEGVREIKTSISEIGIKHGTEIYPFNQIKAFWLIYNDSVSQLHLLMPKRFPRELSIELGQQDPNTLREYLIRQIPEYEDREEKGMDLISRVFKL